MKRPRPASRFAPVNSGSAPGRPPSSRIGLAAFAVAALAYYAAFIWKSSFLVGPNRTFSLFDDAMISMRYARNLARGLGLVWNPGEPPVEGFSNPLWTLLMAPVHGLPLPDRERSLVIQVAGAAILTSLLFATRALCARLSTVGGETTPAHRVPPQAAHPLRMLPWIAMILVGLNYSLVYWTLEGMEVGLLALIATVAAVWLLEGRTVLALYGLLAAGTLVRMDFAVVAVAFAAAGAALDRSRAARHLMVGFAMTIAALALQTAGRMLYFHDPLPNTYYLKLTGYPLGLRWARGAWVLLRSGLLSHGLPVLLPIAAIGISSGQTRRRLLAVLAPCAAMACYSVWVGGDAWEGVIPCNRYMAVALPLALAAGAWPLAALAARAGRFASVGAAILAVAAALAISPHRAVLLLDPPPYTRDNAELTSLGLAAKSLTRDEARVAAAAVGAIGYFSDRPIVDLLGKNDRHVAHRLMRRAGAQSPLTFFFPGHLKWDYPYSIGRLRPDVVAQLWWSVHEADPYLLDYEPIEVRVGDRTVRLAVRRDSRLVIWPAGVSRGQ